MLINIRILQSNFIFNSFANVMKRVIGHVLAKTREKYNKKNGKIS